MNNLVKSFALLENRMSKNLLPRWPISWRVLQAFTNELCKLLINFILFEQVNFDLFQVDHIVWVHQLQISKTFLTSIEQLEHDDP